MRRLFKSWWLRGALLVLLAVGVGWFVGTRMTTGGASADHESTDQIYRDVAGRIVRLAPDDGMMTVDHEEIEGFMPAMVMDLRVADWRELAGFSPGDDIIFDESVTIRYTCTFGSTQLIRGGTLRGTAFAFILGRPGMQYTFTNTASIPR